MGDEEDIGGLLDRSVDLGGLDEFIDVDLSVKFVVGQLLFELVVSFVEGVFGEEITDGNLGILIVFGQLEDDVSSDSGAGTHNE